MTGLSTSCFGTRFTQFSEQVEAARSLDFDQLEIGLSESPPKWEKVTATLQQFAMRVPVLRAGCRESSRGPYRPADEIASKEDPDRNRALQSIWQDIELAKKTSSSTLAITGGFVAVTGIHERIQTLCAHIRQGREKELLELKEEIQLAVKPRRVKHLDRLCRSLFEISRKESGLTIAITTPRDPHFLPSPEEMEQVLEDLPNLPIRYYHDVGSAALLEKLEGIPAASWLEKFAGHLAGIRVHDVIGLDQHLPPGLGQVDWKLIADYAPKSGLRILDIDPQHGSDGIRVAVRFLEKFGL